MCVWTRTQKHFEVKRQTPTMHWCTTLWSKEYTYMHLQIIGPEIGQIYRCYVGGCYVYWVTIQLKNLLFSQHSLCSIACSHFPSDHRFTCVSYIQDMQCFQHTKVTLIEMQCVLLWMAARFSLGPQYIFYSPADLESQPHPIQHCFSTSSPNGILQVDTRMGGSCPGYM